MAARDWFTYTDGSPVARGDTTDDSRYYLDYIRSGNDDPIDPLRTITPSGSAIVLPANSLMVLEF